MQLWDRLRVLALSSILVLCLSAMAIQPALADESSPPPPAPSSPTSSSATAGNNSPTSVPHGAVVVVLDRSGRSVSLASQKAADIVASGDPIWCPVGVAPVNSAGGCSPSFSLFGTTISGDFINWLKFHDPSKAGVIWIEASYNSNSLEPLIHSFTFDGTTDLPNMANFSLTIKGGWSGISGSTSINPATPSTFSNASLSIINWHAPITISDIKLTNVTTNPNHPYALDVQTDKGGITLNRVQAVTNYNPGIGGALLDTGGATLGHPAPVTVNDSSFNDNYDIGLNITSDGAVNIHDLTADYNGLVDDVYGALIYNIEDNPHQPVTFTGNNEFKNNYGTGLWIYSNGAVTLHNMTAFANNFGGSTGDGVAVYNNFGSTPSNVTLTGANLFDYNAQNGLIIGTYGNIFASNITSAYNLTGHGADLDTCLAPGPNAVCATTGKSVTLSGINTFDYNLNDGLHVVSSGAIAISQVTATGNGLNGASLDNCAYNGGSLCQTPKAYNVTISNASTFIYNGTDGLFIHTTGAVSLKNITASFNTYGSSISNAGNLLLQKAVTIGGTNVFNGNYYTGLKIDSYGAITLSNVTANDNGSTGGGFGYGAQVTNDGYSAGPSGSVLIMRMPITLIGINTFNNDHSGGLYAISVGAITASNVTANSSSTGDGAYLYNQDAWYPNFGSLTPYAANVTLSGFGFLVGDYNGIQVFSKGAVTLANLTANYNGVYGALITTKGDLTPQKVSISGVNTFLHDGTLSSLGDGLNVENDGQITISNITAIGNGGSGAQLDNFTFAVPNKFLGVTLTGYNTFQKNLGGYGLYLHTDGSASVSQVNADENSHDGVVIDATKNVTVMCASAYSNNLYGFYLTSGATLTLTGVQDYNNGTDEHLSFVTLHRIAECP